MIQRGDMAATRKVWIYLLANRVLLATNFLASRKLYSQLLAPSHNVTNKPKFVSERIIPSDSNILQLKYIEM